MIYRITWLFLWLFFTLLLRWRVSGAENVPKSGPVIIASNHISYVDPPVIAVSIWRPSAFMAKEELFKNPLFAWYITRLHAFPVKRGTADRASLKQSLELLAQGWPLAMFPEGTRSETGELGEAEMGVGMIAYRSGAPVVPAYIRGTDQVIPKSGGFRLAHVSITYGEPRVFAMPEGGKPGREEYEAAAREIMDAIACVRDGKPART